LATDSAHWVQQHFQHGSWTKRCSHDISNSLQNGSKSVPESKQLLFGDHQFKVKTLAAEMFAVCAAAPVSRFVPSSAGELLNSYDNIKKRQYPPKTSAAYYNSKLWFHSHA
jgi:hypothetical protein